MLINIFSSLFLEKMWELIEKHLIHAEKAVREHFNSQIFSMSKPFLLFILMRKYVVVPFFQGLTYIFCRLHWVKFSHVCFQRLFVGNDSYYTSLSFL